MNITNKALCAHKIFILIKNICLWFTDDVFDVTLECVARINQNSPIQINSKSEINYNVVIEIRAEYEILPSIALKSLRPCRIANGSINLQRIARKNYNART